MDQGPNQRRDFYVPGLAAGDGAGLDGVSEYRELPTCVLVALYIARYGVGHREMAYSRPRDLGRC